MSRRRRGHRGEGRLRGHAMEGEVCTCTLVSRGSLCPLSAGPAPKARKPTAHRTRQSTEPNRTRQRNSGEGNGRARGWATDAHRRADQQRWWDRGSAVRTLSGDGTAHRTRQSNGTQRNTATERVHHTTEQHCAATEQRGGATEQRRATRDFRRADQQRWWDGRTTPLLGERDGMPPLPHSPATDSLQHQP